MLVRESWIFPCISHAIKYIILKYISEGLDTLPNSTYYEVKFENNYYYNKIDLHWEPWARLR